MPVRESAISLFKMAARCFFFHIKNNQGANAPSKAKMTGAEPNPSSRVPANPPKMVVTILRPINSSLRINTSALASSPSIFLVKDRETKLLPMALNSAFISNLDLPSV